MPQSAVQAPTGISYILLYGPVQRTEQKKGKLEIIPSKDDLNNPRNSEEPDKDRNLNQQNQVTRKQTHH